MSDRLDPVAAGDLAAAVAALGDELAASDALARAVAAESGLHPVAARHSLLEWAASLDAASFERLSASADRPPNPATRLLTLAPGNLPIVAAECLLLGLLAGGRHTLATSTRATALTVALSAHVHRWVPDLEARLALVVWRHLNASERDAALRGATRVVAYGTAETVEWIAARADGEAAIVPHGPSVALAWLGREESGPIELDALLRGVALDVARWDQRGCRSPHALLVEGDRARALEVAERLARGACGRVTELLPPGRLTDAEVVGTYLDRLTSGALGDVLLAGAGPDGPAFTLTIEDEPRVLRPSPLGRTLRVIAVSDAARLDELAATLPAPVGTLAVAGADPASLLAATAPLERVPLGTLQRPPFARPHDGRHRLDELRDPW